VKSGAGRCRTNALLISDIRRLPDMQRPRRGQNRPVPSCHVRVLVTNDDGIDAPGIHALASAILDLTHDVAVVAPVDERSGSGAALGAVHLANQVLYERRTLPGLEAVPAFALDGPPALAVLTAARGGFGPPPDLVVSGINAGLNLGRAVIHSGTVGAALTAGNLGIHGLAVSADVGPQVHWETASQLAVAAALWLSRRDQPTVVNLNVPNLAPGDLAGVRAAHLAHFGAVRASFRAVGSTQLEVSWEESGADIDPDSDLGLTRDGFATVTRLAGLAASSDTCHDLGELLHRVAATHRTVLEAAGRT